MSLAVPEPIAPWDPELALIAKTFSFDAGLLVVLLFAAWFFMNSRGPSPFSRLLVFISGVILAFYSSNYGIARLSSYLLTQSGRLALAAEKSACLDNFDTVVVLGGGLVSSRLPSVSSQARLLTASDYLLNMTKAAKRRTVILSGGATEHGITASEAAVESSYLRFFLGPAPGPHEIWLEESSLNTYQNAAFVKRLMTEKGKALSVVLITSPFHMPRAAATFKKMGFAVCALPSNDVAPSLNVLSFRHAAESVQLINEYLGMLGYRLRDWI